MSKFLLTVFLTSLSSLSILTSKAIAQERPKCYIIEPSGKLTDLSDICNVSDRRSPNAESAANDSNQGSNIVNNNQNIIYSEPLTDRLSGSNSTYILGEENFSFDSRVDSSYYIDNQVGIDYTAYIRRYSIPPTSLDQGTLKEQVFRFDDYRHSLTSILRQPQNRLPFIIYRYQI